MRIIHDRKGDRKKKLMKSQGYALKPREGNMYQRLKDNGLGRKKRMSQGPRDRDKGEKETEKRRIIILEKIASERENN